MSLALSELQIGSLRHKGFPASQRRGSQRCRSTRSTRRSPHYFLRAAPSVVSTHNGRRATPLFYVFEASMRDARRLPPCGSSGISPSPPRRRPWCTASSVRCCRYFRLRAGVHLRPATVQTGDRRYSSAKNGRMSTSHPANPCTLSVLAVFASRVQCL